MFQQRMHVAKNLVLPIYISTLTSFIMFKFDLLFIHRLFISSLDPSMKLTNTTNPVSHIKRWKITALFSVVG